MDVSKQTTDFKHEEDKREERLHNRLIKVAMDRIRTVLVMEYHKKEISSAVRKRFIMTPIEFLSKSYVKMSLTDLYRRYRHVRIQSLTEALAIAMNSKSREETKEKLLNKIKEIGIAHQDSKKQYSKKEKSTCAAS